MKYRKITAIIANLALERVERRLERLGVKGVSITKVKGYGDYKNYYSKDWLTNRTRIEIFTDRDRAEEIATAIMEEAHTGQPGDGIVVILPVESVWHIQTKALATPEDI